MVTCIYVALLCSYEPPDLLLPIEITLLLPFMCSSAPYDAVSVSQEPVDIHRGFL